MKKNFYLFLILVSLLGITYYLVEYLPHKNNLANEKWKRTIETSSYLSINGFDVNKKQGKWYDHQGKALKENVINEFLKMLSYFSFLPLEMREDESSYFKMPKSLIIGTSKYLIGDLSASADFFYVKDLETGKVYLIDLNKLPALVLAENEAQLKVNKWNHFQGMLQGEANYWRENIKSE